MGRVIVSGGDALQVRQGRLVLESGGFDNSGPGVASASIESRHVMVTLSPSLVVLVGRNDSEASGYVQKLSISGNQITFDTAVKFEADGDMRANVCGVTSISATQIVTGNPVTAGGVALTNIDVSAAPSLLSGNVITESNSTSTAIMPNADGDSGPSFNVFSGIRRNGRNRYTIATVNGATITTTEQDDLFTPVDTGDRVFDSQRTGLNTGRVITMFADGATFPLASLVSVDDYTTTRSNVIQISLPTGITQLTGDAQIDMITTSKAILSWKEDIGAGAGSDGTYVQLIDAVDTGTPALSGSKLLVPGQSGDITLITGINRVCKLDSTRAFLMYQKSGTSTGPIHYRILDCSGASPVDTGVDVELTSTGKIDISGDAKYIEDGKVIVTFQDDANLGGDVGVKVLAGL